MTKISDLIARSDKPFYSLEFFPPKETPQLPDFFAAASRLRAARPLFVSVTYGAGGGRQENTLEIALALKEKYGFEPMAHLTCVGSTRKGVSDFLERLRVHGIDNVLALRGDAPKSVSPDSAGDPKAGDFKYASDLISFIRENFPDFCIGAAGYPAPHPESPSKNLDRFYTMKKFEAGADFLITQMFFETREYLEFIDDLRALGVNRPVLPGIMPVQSLESLRYVMSLCGAVIPADLKHKLEQAQARGGTEAVKEAGIAHASELARTLMTSGAPGVHLYTLNKSDTCLKIMNG